MSLACMRFLVLTLLFMVLFAWISASGLSAEERWVARRPGYGNALVVDSTGYVYVTGQYGNDGVTIKYANDGDEIWNVTFRDSGSSSTVASALAVDGKGNVYVTGSSGYGGEMIGFLTVKYDSAGNEMWVACYMGPTNTYNYSKAIAVDQEGSVFVAGESKGWLTGTDYAIVKYDSAGNEEWVARYNGPVNKSDIPNDLALDLEGNVYVTGLSYLSESSYDYLTVSYDADGRLLWTASYGGTEGGADIAHALAVDDSGNSFVTGSSDGTDTGRDCVTIKYDNDGELVWHARFNRSYANYDEATDIVIDSAGNAYITGMSFNPYGYYYDVLTVKYDQWGDEVWASFHDGPSHNYDTGRAVAVAPTAHVYVTGYSRSTLTDDDYVTIEYGPDGRELRAFRYNGPDSTSDEACSIDIDLEGNVYVTGQSGNEIATVSYSAPELSDVPRHESFSCLNGVTLDIQPNPFRSSVEAIIHTTSATAVSLSVRDVQGRAVLLMPVGLVEDGAASLHWDGRSASGQAVSPGIYFLTVEAGSHSTTRKVVLVR